MSSKGDKETRTNITTSIHQSHLDHIQQNQISGMTPSIITTINNTSPTPPVNYSSLNNNNSGSLITKNRRTTNEPYESYIEDSFVGHWEHEDDDPIEDCHGGPDGDKSNGVDDDDSALQHPSTIEFDFDSFGPESFIYTPPTTVASATTTTATTVAANSPTTLAPLAMATTNQETTCGFSSSKPSNEPEPTKSPIGDRMGQLGDEDEPSTSSRKDHHHRLSGGALNTNPSDYLVDPEQIDLKVIEPYKKVISHAGYCHHFDPSAAPPSPGESAPAIIVFSACYLPDRSRRDYNYVMDHLFLYVLSSLHELIADDYILIYLHNTQPSPSPANESSGSANVSALGGGGGHEEIQNQNNLPTFTWMKRCYQMIDRKLRKNLKVLYLVKPTFWLKTIVIMCKPFISAKFSKKIRFVEDMNGLRKCLPVDRLILPASAAYI